GGERHRPRVPERNKAAGSRGQLGAQIVMRLEEVPRRRIDPADFESDGWPSLKQPPGEGVAVGTVDPIGIEPRFHVLVASNGDELLLALANGFGQRSTANLGDGTIDRGGELIDDRQARALGQEAGQADAELLTGTEDVIGP